MMMEPPTTTTTDITTCAPITIPNDGTEMTDFLRSLKTPPAHRTSQDIHSLYFTLRSFTCLDRFDDNYIFFCAKSCYYMRKQANDILYCRGEIAQSWFILISGSVFIDGSMFLPITSFGRRPPSATTAIQHLTRRPNECLILEPSEMIVIDYYFETDTIVSSRSSIQSDDTSSAYSGSDTMLSSSNSNRHQTEIDLSGLMESVVDDDEDDDDECDSISDSDSESFAYSEDMSHLETSSMRDCVRECLEKDPSERMEADIVTLLDFTQHLAAFNDLTLTVRKALCASMVFAVVEKAGTVVLSDGEELDSWSVLVNGSVEIVLDGDQIHILSAGDSFGLPPTLDKQYFRGSMRTRVDDCQFVCVTQADYFRILKQGRDNQRIITNDEGKAILVYEARHNHQQQQLQQNLYYSPFIVIRGTKEALIDELFKQENGSVDPTFVEDFLLTQRIFMDLQELAEKIILNFNDIGIRDRVTRVMLLWVNNHFIDFEVDLGLMALLQRFQQMLEQSKDAMSGQLRLLQIACSAKSRPRTVTISRASRDDPLPINIMGGADNGYGIFVSSIEDTNRGIRVGDEVLSVNNINFRGINLSKAFEVLRGSTHLVIVVKCNFLGYHECINSSAPLIPPTSNTKSRTLHQQSASSVKSKHRTLNKHSRFKKALQKINLLPKKTIIDPVKSDEFHDDSDEIRPKIDFPENVLKIYKPDQSHKYFLVNKETTSREVVMLALQEFQENNQTPNSRDYALFQVSVNSVNGSYMLKQTKLPDALDSLAERLQLGSRYYIKRVECTEPLVPTELLPELFKESEVGLLNLNPTELALQLTLEDYACFRQIEMTEFIDDLFQLNSKYGTPNLSQFAQLVNRETFWVVTEIVKEQSLTKRVLIIKRFIKVALQCRECRNFNSMFAIVSGLGHSAVSRLKGTWDKLSKRYNKFFGDLQDLMDPSRNMGKYRSLLSSSFQTPMIPFYPVVKKDLTFIDLGNSTEIDAMINFEKMRMVAKEIRNLIQMSAAPFDTSGLSSVAAMNQLANNPVLGKSTLTTTTGKKLMVNSSGNKKSSIRSNSSNQPNPKKMYEEMNMIRKVKAYLRGLKIIEDENLLHEKSLVCEGNANTLSVSSNSVNRVRKPPSPTLSTASSTNSERAKFGSNSPKSYQKLLALSEPSLNRGNGNGNNSARSKMPPPPAVAVGCSSNNGTLKAIQQNSSKHKSTTALLSTESSSVLPATIKD